MSQPAMEPMTSGQAEEAIANILGAESSAEQEAPQGETRDAEQDNPTGNLSGESDDSETEDSTDSDDESEGGEPDEESEESQEISTDDEEQKPIETLAELSEALELPVEELMATLKTTVKVNGENLTVTLKEAFDGYQKDIDYRRKTESHAREREAFEAESETIKQALAQQRAALAQVFQQARNEFIQPLSQEKLEYLKENDPQQYLLHNFDQQQREQRFNQFLQTIDQQQREFEQGESQRKLSEHSKLIEKARAELNNRIPDWNDNLKKEIDQYLTGESYGFSNEEIAQVADPRVVEIINKARLFDENQKKASVVTKKVKTLPKMQSKAPLSKPTGKDEIFGKLKTRLKKTGSLDDAAAALSQLM